MFTKIKIITGLLMTLAATVAFAGKDKHEHTTPTTVNRTNEPLIKVTFSTAEVRTIRAYYHDAQNNKHGKQLPPGLQKKVARGGQLPPGWQKKLARGEVMAPDIYTASKPVPTTLIQQLPPQPPGVVIVH